MGYRSLETSILQSHYFITFLTDEEIKAVFLIIVYELSYSYNSVEITQYVTLGDDISDANANT